MAKPVVEPRGSIRRQGPLMRIRPGLESPFFANHMVFGEGLFPAVGFLGLVVEALAESRGEAAVPFPLRFADARWLTPFWAGDGNGDLVVDLETRGPQARYRIQGAETAESVLHAMGTVTAGPEGEPPTPPLPVDPSGIENDPHRLDRREIYRTFGALGLRYSGTFEALESISLGAEGASGRIAVTESAGNLLLAPGPLDAAIQGALLHVHLRRDRERLYVPFSVGQLVCHGPLPSDCDLLLKSVGSGADGLDFRYDAALVDADGHVVVEMKDLCVKAFPAPGGREAVAANGKEVWAVAATFTAEPLETPLRFWAEALGSDADIAFAPYNQVFQQLLAPDSLLSEQRSGARFVLLRLEDLRPRPTSGLARPAADEVDAALAGTERHSLPNGLEIAHLKAYETDYLYEEIFVEQTYLKHGIELPEDAVVVDIGANVGLFSLFVAERSPGARILACEPSPITHAVLEKNLGLYAPGAAAIQVGVGEGEGEAEFTFYPNSSVFSGFHAVDDEEQATLRTIVANELAETGRLQEADDAEPYLQAVLEHRLQREAFRCRRCSLSGLIRDHGLDRIDLLKVDAEKCELEILDGIAEADWPKIRQIVVEVHDKEGSVLEEVRRRLSAHGFDVAVVEERALANAGLYNLYGRRPQGAARAAPRSPEADLGATVAELVDACRHAAPGPSAPLIVALCPPSPNFAASVPAAEMARLEGLLAEGLDGLANVSLLRLADYAGAYAWGDPHDPQRDAMGHIPYTPRFFAALATVLARRLHLSRRPPYKVIALDCDNTLWSGAVGEQGVDGIDIAPAYQVLQRFMRRQKEQGMLLCLVSKNDEADVRAVFENRPEMVLGWNDVTLSKINWEPKSDNLRALADKLNVGLDGVIFVDDNPVECAEVQAALPQVLTLNLPTDREAIPGLLDRVWAFDQLRFTAEDAKRTEHYKQDLARQRARSDFPTLKDFIDNLRLEIHLDSPKPADLARLAQLTQRTNQFNVHKRALSEATFEALAAAEDTGCFTLRAADRFGDYGLCGLATYAVRAGSLDVDAFLMSCRVLGRGVEHRMLAALGAEAARRGLGTVRVPFVAGARNRPAEKFLLAIGPSQCLEEDDRVVFVFAADDLVGLAFTPPETAPAAGPDVASGAPDRVPTATAASNLIRRVATEFASLDDLLAAIAPARGSRQAPEPAAAHAPVSAGTLPGYARRLVLETLGDQLGVAVDDLDGAVVFSDLGMDSIAGIDLIVRLNDALDIVMPPTTVFDYVRGDDLAAYLCRDFTEALRRHMGETEFEASASRVSNTEPAPAPVADTLAPSTEAVAIVGLSGRFPGAPDVDAFWELLATGGSAVSDVPAMRWDAEAIFDSEPGRPGKSYSTVGGFLDDVDRFDAAFFDIADDEAAAMDPAQRLFLEECWRALEDAGYAAHQSDENAWGVYVGTDGGDYAERLNAAGVSPGGAAFIGSDASMLAARIAYFLNLKGGALAVDAACSSSLAAVHLGCKGLLDGDMDLVIAGGVSVATTPKYHILCSQPTMLASDGRCKPFDDAGDGFVIGEAVGAVVLKRLSDARRDGDPIHGVILGSALNQDGTSNGITAPNSAAQSALAARAYQRAGVDPAAIGYVEAHGTGTRLGDCVEAEALSRVFRDHTDRTGFCALGSVKGNIGHCLHAAGISSLIKLVLCLRQGKLLPSVNFRQPNRHVDFAASPFYVSTVLCDWPAQDRRARVGAVNALGFSGTNVHMVV
ncbi:MAG: FkbM family methyltransferase, partial [Alphaproteobacteria bacterium]|nr:FkbM family methyltransferase [Alphaproteobacteria bacterium]